MRAALYDTEGPARTVLRVDDVEAPEPAPGQVRVRLAVSGVNPTDVKTRDGTTPRAIEGFQIPHQDGAGAIDAVGNGVDPDRLGQRVWVWFAAFRQQWGTAGQWCVIDAERAVPLPDDASYELGASLGVPAMTAYHCLFVDGPVEDRTVLVAGGAGAVGHFAVELAKRRGARVIASVSSTEKAEQARRAGADHVVQYTDSDVIDQVRGLTSRVDRVVEVALAANLELDLALSGPGTTVVTYAAAGDPTLPVRSCMSANVTLRFMMLYGVPAEALAEASRGVTEALRDGALSPLPVHRFGLDRIVEAHEAVEAGASGKVLVDVS